MLTLVSQKNLNLKIKFRESFRPFAPSVLCDKVENWFDFKHSSPYMLYTVDISEKVKKNISKSDNLLKGLDKLNVSRSKIPAVTHVNNSARIQTVHKNTNPLFYKLIKSFSKKTGCDLLINTSFNVRGEPIVCSTLDAFKCFMGYDMDVLARNFILYKKEQDLQLLKTISISLI